MKHVVVSGLNQEIAHVLPPVRGGAPGTEFTGEFDAWMSFGYRRARSL